MTSSVTSPEPSPVLTLTTKNKIFLDDPTQTKPITIDQTHLPPLKNNDYLGTRLINYLVQRSVHIKEEQRTVIASSMSATLMTTFLKKTGITLLLINVVLMSYKRRINIILLVHFDFFAWFAVTLITI